MKSSKKSYIKMLEKILEELKRTTVSEERKIILQKKVNKYKKFLI